MAWRRRGRWILGSAIAVVLAMAVLLAITTRRGDEDDRGTSTTATSPTATSDHSSRPTSSPSLSSPAPTDEYICVVHDSGDQPVAGAVVRVSDELSISRRYTTDANGEARVRATTDMLFEASHPVAGRGHARLGSIDEVSHRLVIRLAPGEAGPPITGHVVDVDHKPVPHAVVRAMHVMVEQHPRSETRADGDGAFRIDGLDAGMHVVWVVCDGCSSSRARASTGEDITLVVGGGGVVAGQVIDANDKPVSAFTVRLLRPRAMREVPLEERSVNDADGRFELGGVEPDTYIIRVVAAGHAPSDGVPVTLAADRAEVIVRVATGGTIAGVVTDRASGSPIANATVAIDRIGGRHDTVVSTISDASGSYVLAGVPVGVLSVTAIAPEHHVARASGLHVEDGRTLTSNLQLAELRPGEQPGTDQAGIGARMYPAGDAMMIQEVIAGGGAQAAGLVVGDAVLTVDGQRVSELGNRDAIERMRGPEGTKVVLGVRRSSDGPTVDVTVERRPFRYSRS